MLYEGLWSDRKFRALGPDAKLLFIWSWSPPHSAACGLYRASWKDLEDAIDGPGEECLDDRVALALEQLGEAGMVKYDPDREVLWVVNRVKYAPTTERAFGLMRRELRACPESPLVDEFVDRWGELLGVSR